MYGKVKENISNWLNKFEFVKWDRFIETIESYCIYGWIDREDNYKDFLEIDFDKKLGKPTFWLSSSAKFDEKIIEVLKHPETMALAINNVQCKRVEDYFNVNLATKLKSHEVSLNSSQS